MAEALAVVGVVASIIQLVDFSTTVLYRLKEYQSSVGEIPKSFRQISKELPLLLYTLHQIQEAIETSSVEDDTKKALLPVIKGCREEVELLETIITRTLPKSDDSRLEKSKKALSSLGQDGKVERISKNLRNYISTLTFYYSAASSTLQPLEDTKLIKIRQWLSPPDPSVNYQKALKQRQADTGQWFLNSNEYTKWKTDAASTMWLHGIPGCGKTILSSTIIQNIFQHCLGDPGKVVAYFYFDFNDTQKQIPELMVRSLICQLSQKCVTVPKGLESLFSSCKNGQQQPSLDALLDVLQQMIQGYPQPYIVLDALDECKDRVELMGILEQITRWQPDKLRLLVTSRKEREIQISLERLVEEQNVISLESRLVDDDIQKYVRKRLLEDINLKKWQKDSDVRHEIEFALMRGANGMFRWTVCQLDALGKCRNRLMLRNSLAALPRTLDETYERILCGISKEDSEYAIRILRWLAFSSRPLLVEEISEVVAIDVERDPMFDRQEVLEDPLEVLDICSSLITVTTTDTPEVYPQIWKVGYQPTGKVVRLAHYSVKEYLVSERSRQSRAEIYSIQDATCNEFLAKSCLGYLLQFGTSETFSSKDVEASKLARYAAEFWITHTQAAGERGAALSHQIVTLLSKRDKAYLNWTKLYLLESSWKGPEFTRRLEDVPSPLYVTSLLGWTDIIKLLLSMGADVNDQGGEYGTALQIASAKGNEQVVEQLLRSGADINAQSGEYGTALQAASFKGHEKVIEQLLSAGADVNAQGGEYGTALQAASARHHEKVIERLLSAGADVNAQAGEYGTALQAASATGRGRVIEQLLGAGADVNRQGGRYGTALQAACARGHDKVVEQLLSAGADVNSQGGRHGTALQAASTRGREKIVERLLSVGAIRLKEQM